VARTFANRRAMGGWCRPACRPGGGARRLPLHSPLVTDERGRRAPLGIAAIGGVRVGVAVSVALLGAPSMRGAERGERRLAPVAWARQHRARWLAAKRIGRRELRHLKQPPGTRLTPRKAHLVHETLQRARVAQRLVLPVIKRPRLGPTPHSSTAMHSRASALRLRRGRNRCRRGVWGGGDRGSAVVFADQDSKWRRHGQQAKV